MGRGISTDRVAEVLCGDCELGRGSQATGFRWQPISYSRGASGEALNCRRLFPDLHSEGNKSTYLARIKWANAHDYLGRCLEHHSCSCFCHHYYLTVNSEGGSHEKQTQEFEAQRSWDKMPLSSWLANTTMTVSHRENFKLCSACTD